MSLLDVQVIDLRNGDVLLEHDVIVDHLEHDHTKMSLVVARGQFHCGWWYLNDAIVSIDRPLEHSMDTLGTEHLWCSTWNRLVGTVS